MGAWISPSSRAIRRGFFRTLLTSHIDKAGMGMGTQRNESKKDRTYPKIDRDLCRSRIKEALEEGATDDGQIIKWAYRHEVNPDEIICLRKYLKSMQCRSKARCPYKRNRMRFQDIMSSCKSAMGNCQFLEYDPEDFYEMWKGNRDRTYEEYVGGKVTLKGRIMETKEVARSGNNRFFHLHLFDVRITPAGKDGAKDPRYARDIWLEISRTKMLEFDRISYFCMDDTVSVDGGIVFYEYFGDYWLVDVTGMETLERSGLKPVVKY